MRLSESLRRGIMETSVGGIINRFKVKSRRATFFFEDILAEYIHGCEKKGYGEEMREIGEYWGVLSANALVPETAKKLPLPLFSEIVKVVWTNLGTLDDIEIKRSGEIIRVTTKNEAITRAIGRNKFSTGTYGGILGAILGSKLKCTGYSQGKESSEYMYEATGEKVDSIGKDKSEYNRRNYIPPISGCTLKDAVKKNILQLKGNRIYFRGKSIGNAENTLFHIFGNRNIVMNSVPEISRRYFSEILDRKQPIARHLLLLKTLLQVMGWGAVKIIMLNERNIKVEIAHAPCGLQPENDNWNFLVKSILGYLRAVDSRFKIKKARQKQESIMAEFCIEKTR